MKDNRICVHADLSRRLPVVDPDDRELYISIGAAVENLVIAAEHGGCGTSVTYSPVADPVCVEPGFPGYPGPLNEELFNAIHERQSTRSEYDGKPIPDEGLRKLSSLSLEEGVSVIIVTDRELMGKIAGLVREGNNIQMNDPAFMQELGSWIRFNRKEVERYRDGLSFETTGSPPVPRMLGKLFMKFFLTAGSQSRKDENNISSSSAMMLVLSENNDVDSWIKTGRSFERLALCATSLGIRNAHLNQPCEIPELKSRLRELPGVGDRHPQLLLRLGYADELARSPRRDVKDVVMGADLWYLCLF